MAISAADVGEPVNAGDARAAPKQHTNAIVLAQANFSLGYTIFSEPNKAPGALVTGRGPHEFFPMP